MMENNDFMHEGMDERAKNFEQMLNAGDNFFYDSDELGQLIDYYLDFEETSKANNAITYAESIYPFEIFYKIKKAEVYIQQRKINEAIKLLEKYRTIEPSNGEIAKTLGDCYLVTLQYKRALDCYLFSHTKDTNNEDLLHRLARVNFALGNNKKALYYLNIFPKEYITDELNIQEFMRLFMDYNLNNEAISFLEKVINEDPYSYSAWYFQGLIYQKQEKYLKAVNSYEFCIAIEESNTMGHLGKGNCLLELEDYTKAIESFKLSLDQDESDAEVYCNIAECYENMNDDAGAKHFYQKSIHTNPILSDAYFGLAMVYKRAFQWQDSETNLLKSIDLDPYESMYHIEIAEVFLIKEDKVKCYHHYYQAHEIDPEVSEIILDFSHAMFELGEISEAITLLLKSVDDYEEDSRFFYRLASYSLAVGYYEQGYIYLHEALSLDSDKHSLLFEFFPDAENLDTVRNIIDLYL